MAAGPKTRRLDGIGPGWNGSCREFVAVSPSDTVTDVFEPPLRKLIATGAGTVTLVLDTQDPATAGHRFQITMTANQILDGFAIRAVRATGTAATGLLGFR